MKKGFTFLELIFVIGIITILLSFILPAIKGMHDESNIAKAQAELAILQTALETYYTQEGSYPELSGEDLQTELINKTRLFNKKFQDPFAAAGVSYEFYVAGGKYYLLLSRGLNRTRDLDYSSNYIDWDKGSIDRIALTADKIDDIYETNLK